VSRETQREWIPGRRRGEKKTKCSGSQVAADPKSVYAKVGSRGAPEWGSGKGGGPSPSGATILKKGGKKRKDFLTYKREKIRTPCSTCTRLSSRIKKQSPPRKVEKHGTGSAEKENRSFGS